jgi:hypothetical protein
MEDRGWLLRAFEILAALRISTNRRCGLCCNDRFVCELDGVFRSRYGAPLQNKRKFDPLPLNTEMLDETASELDLINNADLIKHQDYIWIFCTYWANDWHSHLAMRTVERRIKRFLIDSTKDSHEKRPFVGHRIKLEFDE